MEWTEDCEAAFRTLKEKICSSPVLQSPDFNQRFMCVIVWFYLVYVEVKICVYKMSVVNWYRDYWNMYCLINGTSKEGAESGL